MRSYICHLVLGLCFVAAASGQLFGQDKIAGTVKDQKGAFVAGASVSLQKPSTSVSLTAVTGTNGSFLFQGLSAGEYDLSVAATGFRLVSKKVNAGSTVDIALESARPA